MKSDKSKQRSRDPQTSTISNDEVQNTFDAFIAALYAGDYQTLRELYDDDYLLVRPDGTLLGKMDILNDLKEHSMVLSCFETTPISLKTRGTVGILTTEVKCTFIRDGHRQGTTHARQIAIFVKTGRVVTLTHFQSTRIATSCPSTSPA
ncbi:MAG: nuclear transport factor 2 family protein [Terracidiphilus sp.]|jgi:ketosteroid isomerase-like protein